jgi:hypothetical protein
MRFFLLFTLVLLGCEEGGDVSFGSREQLKYIAQYETRLRKVDDAIRDFHERYKFSEEKPDPVKKAAMETVSHAHQIARAKLDELKGAGSSRLKELKPQIEQAITDAENALAAVPAM